MGIQEGAKDENGEQGDETSDARLKEESSSKASEVIAGEPEIQPPPVPDWDEAENPRPRRAPRMPSAKYVEERNFTHCPPRTWCEHCVRGLAKDAPSRTVR